MKAALLKSIVGMVLLGAACAANASVILPNTSPGVVLGLGGVADIPTTIDVPGSINDNYYFTTLVTASVGVGIASLEIPSAYSISGLVATLFSSTNTNLGSGQSFLLGSLPAGTYDINVTGDATGPSGGAYAGLVKVASPVPLPAAVWLLLSGIAGVGGFARRRKTEVLA